MGNKELIMRECDRANAVRRVCTGAIDYVSFFHNIRGNLFLSGQGADNIIMLSALVHEFAVRKDMPTIVLTSHNELLQEIKQNWGKKVPAEIRISGPGAKNYHPMYGMSSQQILKLIRATGEEMGCGAIMDRVLLYAAAIINIVAAKYQVSLPAMSVLLKEDDDFIADFASQMELSNVIIDNILGNHEAGIMFRRIVERIEEVFETVCEPENDTQYNFQSGAGENMPVMAFYQIAAAQTLMNSYLKEEIYSALKKVPRIRLVLDEAVFTGETDELLTSVFQMKRQGKMELIAVSRDVKEMFYGMSSGFENICLFRHDSPVTTENLSREMFGSYQYHYPVPSAGKPPALLFTLRREIRWQVNCEERLRVRAVDLSGNPQLMRGRQEYIAVKTYANGNVYLIPRYDFMGDEERRLVLR